MATGMEMMMQSLIKMMGLKPEVVMEKVEEIRKSIMILARNSEIVRRQNSAIMSHLGIADIVDADLTLTNGFDHDRADRQGHDAGQARTAETA